MKIRQRWYRRHQLFNQLTDPSLLPWLFDTLLFDDSSVPVVIQDWQKLKQEVAIALENIHFALIVQVLWYCEGGSIDDRLA